MKRPLLMQRGVVLTIALLLLLVLTVLAVTSLHSAGSELALAGNDKLRIQAGAAAESGIEAAMVNLSSASLQSTTQADLVLPGDSRVRTTTTHAGDVTLIPGYSVARFVGRSFELRAIGHAARGARAERVQGALRIELAPP